MGVFCEDRYYKGWSVPTDTCLKNEKQVTVIDFQLFFSLLIHFYNLNSLSSAQPRNINSLLRASWKQETPGKMHSHWHPAFPDHENLRSQVTCSSTEFEHKLQGWMNESLNTTKIIRKMRNNMFFKALLTFKSWPPSSLLALIKFPLCQGNYIHCKLIHAWSEPIICVFRVILDTSWMPLEQDS